MTKTLIFLFLTFAIFQGNAQELNCQVSVVSTPDFSATANDQEVFQDLESNITEFMNTTSFTNDLF